MQESGTRSATRASAAPPRASRRKAAPAPTAGASPNAPVRRNHGHVATWRPKPQRPEQDATPSLQGRNRSRHRARARAAQSRASRRQAASTTTTETGRRTYPAGEKPPSRHPGANTLPKQPRERIIISRQLVVVTLNDGKPTFGSDRLASLMGEFGAKLQQDWEHNEDAWHNIRPDAPRSTMPSVSDCSPHGSPTPGSPRQPDDVLERVLGDPTALPAAAGTSSLGSPLVASVLPSESTPPRFSSPRCPPLVDDTTVPTDIATHTTIPTSQEDIITTIRGPYHVNCSSQFAAFEETADDCPVSAADNEDNSASHSLAAVGAPPALTKAERKKRNRQEKRSANLRDDALLEAATAAAQLEAVTIDPPAAASPKAQKPARQPTSDSEPQLHLLDKSLADAIAARE